MTDQSPAALFRRRDRLAAELREVDAHLDAARRVWSDQCGYLVPVRVEVFRRECRSERYNITGRDGRTTDGW